MHPRRSSRVTNDASVPATRPTTIQPTMFMRVTVGAPVSSESLTSSGHDGVASVLHRPGVLSAPWSGPPATTLEVHMSTMTTTTALERYRPALSELEQTTLVGFLAGYRGFTRDAYTLDLRQFTAWC